MSKMDETPKSIEEALQGRPGAETETEEEIQDPTLDETIQAMRREAELQRTLSAQPQETLFPPTFLSPMDLTTTTNSETNSPKLTTPEPPAASIIDPPPVEKTSTQASAKALRILNPVSDIWPKEMIRVAEFLSGPDFNPNWVERQIRMLSTIPEVIPPTTQWLLSAEVDLPRLAYDIIMTPGWVSRTWPSIRILLGSSIGNVQWVVKVLCTLAVLQAVSVVGMFDGKAC